MKCPPFPKPNCPPDGPHPLTPDQAKNSFAAKFGRIADKLRQLNTNFGIRPDRVFLTWSKWTGVERGMGDEIIIRRAEILPTPRVTSLDNVKSMPMHSGMVKQGTLRVDEISVQYFTRDVLMGKAFPGDAVTVHNPANPVDSNCINYPGIPGRQTLNGSMGAGLTPPNPGPDMPPLPAGPIQLQVQGSAPPIVYSPDPLPFGEDIREKHIPEPIDFYYEVVQDGRLDNPAMRMRFTPASEPALLADQVYWTMYLERESLDRTRQDRSAIAAGIEG